MAAHLDDEVIEILERHAPPPAVDVLTDALSMRDITAQAEAAVDGAGVILHLSEGDARALANYLNGPFMEPAPGAPVLRACVVGDGTGTGEDPSAPPVSDS
ncbi:hypothetical protein [Streptacidiphilus sp. MAP12-33]|uniref:hypothetical protein n=1 Tax=Streptacidiphilus sp. MAP12-33 TaxID=3156266 RepID=UPI0035164996